MSHHTILSIVGFCKRLLSVHKLPLTPYELDLILTMCVLSVSLLVTPITEGETRYKSPCKSHISNIKPFLPVEAEISVTKIFIMANMKNSKSHGKQEVDVQYNWKGETRYKSPCQSHISNVKSFLPVEAEISITKVFITANMKNSKSRGKQEVEVR